MEKIKFGMKWRRAFLATVLVSGVMSGAVGGLASSSASAMGLEDRMALYESYTFEGQGLISKAIEKMTGILEKNKTDYFVNYRLGWLFYLEKKYKNAVEHYQKAGELAPSSVEPWLGASLVYVMTGDFSNSVGMCKEALKRDPQNYTCLQRSAYSLIQMKNYSKAIEMVNAALKLYPSDATFLEQKSYALQESGHREDAKNVATALITISPKNLYAKKLLSGS